MPAAADTGGERAALFGQPVCGIDGSEEAVEAARQLALLAPAGSVLRLLADVNPGAAAPGGVAVVRSLEELEEEAEANVACAAEGLPPGTRWESQVITGLEIEAIRAQLERSEATVVAVGGPPAHRLAGAVLGSVASALLHSAPCSVLVARGEAAPGEFPRTLLVGLDGSEAAGRALSVACEMGDRLGVPVRALTALDDHIDLDATRAAAAAQGVELEEVARPAVDALVETGPELLVLGSRGLSGLRALGSVSERAAHRSSGSVLVVR